MKVVVTGGAGFIGSHTVEELIEKGHEVIIVDSLTNQHSSYVHPEAVFYKADITDEVKMDEIFSNHQPDAVIHLAAQVDVQKSLLDPALDVHTNIKGTVVILENCRKVNAKIVFASSAAVYGMPQSLPISEKHVTEPLSVYGLSKLTVESYISLYQKLYGVTFSILRYANVYGPRQDASGEGGVISIFIDRLINGDIPVIYGDGEQTRDFIYVKDLARANVNAAENTNNQILNISSNTELSINELFYKIAKVVGKEVTPLYRDQRTGDITRSVLDSSVTNRELNWKPEYTLENGLEATVHFARALLLESAV